MGTTSAATSVTVTNTGNASLSFTSMAMTGDFAVAASGTTCSTSASVAASSNCVINVTFTPTATGSRSGSLTLTDNASTSPQMVTLSGTGTAPAVTLSATTLNFTSQAVGTTSAAQSVTLSNTGTAALAITSITVSVGSSDFSQNSTCGSTLAASANCTISVTFKPSEMGTRTGTVMVTDNAGGVAGSTQTVSLMGMGGPPALASIAVTPANVSLSIGSTQQFTATGTYTDGSTQNLTSTAAWSSSTPTVATISNASGSQGLATPEGVGSTTIQAASGTITGSTTFTVTSAGFIPTGSQTSPSQSSSVTQLTNGTVLIVGGDNNGTVSAMAQIYNPATGKFTLTGSLNLGREHHTATLLPNGMVLIAGGCTSGCSGATPTTTPTNEIYNPATGAFSYTGGTLNTQRQGQTATLLANGLVLLAGGSNASGVLASAELYNSRTGTFTFTGSLNSPRAGQTGTLLLNGQVLLAGGANSSNAAEGSSEIYNPATGAFTLTGSLNTGRYQHSETLLDNGTVLIAGGVDVNGNPLASAEVYTPSSGTFTYTTGSGLSNARAEHTATLLSNGYVLLAGGENSSGVLTSAELYYPATATFVPAVPMNYARALHAGTLLANGLVLVAGGMGSSATSSSSTGRVLAAGGTDPSGTLASAELYEPQALTPPNLVSIAITPSGPTLAQNTSQTFTATGKYQDGSTQQLTSAVWSSSNPAVVEVSNDASSYGAAYALAAGSATVSACAGAVCGSTTVTVTVPPVSLSTSILAFSATVATTSPAQAVTLTNNGTAALAITGITLTGANAPDFAQTNTCGASVAAGANCTISVTFTPAASGNFTAAVSIADNAAGSPQTISLTGTGVPAVLASITVTPANPSIPLSSTQQFTATGTYNNGTTQNLTTTVTWSSSNTSVATISNASGSQGLATATGLGTTTIAAASGAINASTTLTVGAGFALTGSLNTARAGGTATLLPNGMVLIAGGCIANCSSPTPTATATAELYSPASGTFTSTGSLNTARSAATATLLPNGMVLIAGGINATNWGLNSAELYNPATGTFTVTGTLNAARYLHTATLLPNGLVLMAGGYNSTSGWLSSAELYIPAIGTFAVTGSLNTPRSQHSATLLPNGMVLIAGGYNNPDDELASAELYNPATGAFTTTVSLNTARYSHTATLLNNGLVLIAGGAVDPSEDATASAELYNPTTGVFTSTGSLNVARFVPTATLLNNGQVLIAGGYNSSGTLATAELYDPTAATFTYTGSLTTARFVATATLLTNGMVLVAGGYNPSTGAFWSSAELYNPATLTPPNLVSISVTPSSPTIPLDTAQRFTATGTFSSGSPEQLVSVTWSSSNPAAVTITNDSTDLGVAYAVGSGATTISACAGTVCGSTTATEGPPALLSIAVTPANATVAAGLSQQFTATGTYSDGSTQNLTTTATWSSSAPTVATVSTGGLATGLIIGSATITAASGTVQGSATLMVTAPLLMSITVTPANPSISLGSTQQFTATGTYTDASTQNLTTTATWSSSATSVATISNASGSQGLAAATGIGTTTIEAASGAINGSTTLTVTAGFVLTGSLNTARYDHTATLLNNGMVLMAGGLDVNNNPLASAELYNPATGTFTPTGSLNTARYLHTATLLDNGMVLIAGGSNGGITLLDNGMVTVAGGDVASAELYNPATGTFTPAGSLNTARYSHTATLLNNGMVLMAGGLDVNNNPLASAELYNPTTGAFTYAIGSLNTARYSHTATLLNNGMVLMAGGFNGNPLASAELYDPVAETFSTTGALNTARQLQTATLLNNGMVLIAGGYGLTSILASAELYDPVAGTFNPTGSLNTARYLHTATLLNNGMVLMTGGFNYSLSLYVAQAELYDPTAGTFTYTGSLNAARDHETATLLNNGMVLISGGLYWNGSYLTLASAELYEPATLTPPNLVSIALSPSSPTVPLDTAQRFTATGTFSGSSPEQLVSVTWSSSNPAIVSISDDASDSGAAYAVASGSATVQACAGTVCGSTTATVGPPVLVSVAVTPATAVIALGGTQQFTATGTYSDGSTQNLTSTATWSSSATAVATISNTSGSQGLATATGAGTTTITAASGTISGSTTLTVSAGFVNTGSMNTPRQGHTATLLNNGMVLVAGGANNSAGGTAAASAELYNPATGTFTYTGNMNTARSLHTATLLNNGLVLIAGGAPVFESSDVLASAELYNPATGTFTPTGSLNTARFLHTATLLPNGMVLIAGGSGVGGTLASAELYNPVTGSFTPIGSLNTARSWHTATPLNNGMVLIAGGQDVNGNPLASAELYNPSTGTFSYTTGSLNAARQQHTATLLNNGMVLMAGGGGSSGTLASVELYNSSTGAFAPAGSLNTARLAHTATLLNNGMVLIRGGVASGVFLDSAELYNPATGSFSYSSAGLITGRAYFTATLLNNGMVLLAGGGSLASAELYEPGTLTPPNLASIALSPSTPTVPVDTAQRLIATGTLSDNSTEQLAEVTWSSSNPAVISISNDASNPGAAYAAAAGSATVSGCAGTVCGSTTVTVGPPALVSIAVTPANPVIALAGTQQFAATGTYSDGSTQNFTSTVTWSSSATTVATISNTSGSQGLATATGLGTTTIAAASGAINGSTTLMVTSTGTAPVATLTPTSLSFASQNVGTPSAAQSVTLSNTGNAALTASIVVTGTDAGDFAQTNNCATSMAGGASCTINVIFTPSTAWTRAAALTIADNAPGSPQTVSLTGTGSAPEASPTASSLTFTGQNVGTTSAAQIFALYNTGNVALSITSIGFTGTNPGDFAQSNTCGSSLAVGSNCTISVTFTPAASATRTATLTITDNSNNVAGSTQSVSLTGTGVGPIVSPSPSTLSFGTQNLGTSSSAQTVTLTNTGNANLTITSISVTGTNSGDFSQSNTCGSSVAANGTCTISVIFKPSVAGAESAAVTITDNAAGSPQSIALTGTGAGPVVSLSPTTLTFAGQNVGTTSTAQTATLTNSGNATLTIGSIVLIGIDAGDFSQTNNCPASVTAGGSCTISVTFMPTTPGYRSATVNITDNAANSPQTVSLIGTGLGAIASISPVNLNFGGLDVGASTPAQSVTLTNTGNVTLTIGAIAISGTDAGDFAETNNCGSSVAAGNSCTINVTFAPSATGTRTAFLTISDSAPPGLQEVAMSGMGGTLAAALPCEDSGSESLLSGQYAFSLSGFNSTGYLAVVGSFTADGTGKITAGEVDSNGALGVQTQIPIDTTASSYSVGSNHLGCATIVTSFGTFNTRLALGSLASSVATEGRLVEWDPPSSSTYFAGTGHLLQQNSSSFSSGLNGSYAFGVSGWDSTNSVRLALAGVMSASGGAFANLVEDENDGGTVTNITGLTGTYSSFDTNGRATTTFSSGGTQVSTGTIYVVSPSELLYLQSSTPVVIGEMTQRTVPAGGFSNGSLNGTVVYYKSGLASSGSGGQAELGVASVNGTGSFTGTDYDDQDGTWSTPNPSTLTCTYSVASNGRTTFTGGGCGGGVLYLTDANTGFLLGGGSGVQIGQVEPQVVPSGGFTDASIAGTFYMGDGEVVHQAVNTGVGVVTLNSSGGLSGAADYTATSGQTADQALTGMITVNSDGTFSTIGGAINAIFISSTKFVAVDYSSNTYPIILVGKQ